MDDLDLEEPDDEEEDDSDLRRRTFLERHDGIPWIAAAILVGGSAGLLQGYFGWP